MLGAAARHRGSAFVEILQNCNIYNDGAFDYVRDEKANRIYLESGQPIRFGENGERGVVQYGDGSARVVDVDAVGEGSLLVHDAHHREPSLAFALSRITFETDGAVPLGVFRALEQPVYDDLMSEQLETARETTGRRRPRRAAPLRRHLGRSGLALARGSARPARRSPRPSPPAGSDRRRR